MADSFDPYHKWLGIPPKDQPPNHYRLLALELFESDPDVIESAADQRMAHVRTFQTGQNSALSQRILNELSAAKICLLNPQKKAEYDRQLREKMHLAGSSASDADRRSDGATERPRDGVPDANAAVTLPPQSLPPSVAPLLARPLPQARLLPQVQVLPLEQPLPVVIPEPIATSAYPKRLSRKKPVWQQPAILTAASVAAIVLAVAIYWLAAGGSRPDPVVAANTPNVNTTKSPSTPLDPIKPAPEKSNPPTPKPPSPDSPAVSPAEPDFEIIEAKWGTGDKWVNVTEGVRSRVKDNRLLMMVWSNMFGSPQDPAPGVGKVLRIRYRSRGRQYEADYPDVYFVYLDGNPLAPPTDSPNSLELLEARYGAGVTYVDVLPQLRDYVRDGRLSVPANIFAAATAQALTISKIDSGTFKVLWIRYRNGTGEHFTYAWNDTPVVIESHLPDAAGPPVDMLKLIDLKRDVVEGEWKLAGGILHAPGTHEARIQLPLDAPEEYALSVVAQGDPMIMDVCALLPVDGHQVLSVIDGFGGVTTGLQVVNGMRADSNPSHRWRCARLFEQGRPNTLIYVVRRTSVQIFRDGAEILRWSGDANGFSIADAWKVPSSRRIALKAYDVPFRVSKLELVPLVPEKSPMLTKLEPGKTVDLLKNIDLDRDVLEGAWQCDGESLVSPVSTWVQMQLPMVVPADYRINAVVQRESGNDCLGFTLPVAGAQVSLMLDAGGGTACGLKYLDGKDIQDNETKSQGGIFADGRPKPIAITVRKNRVRAECEGRQIVDWTGNTSRLTPATHAPYKDRIYLGEFGSRYRLTKIEVTPLGPEEAEPPTTENLAATKSKPIDLLKQTDPMRDAVKPGWRIVKGALVTPEDWFTSIMLPPPPSLEYQLVVVAERERGANGLVAGLVVDGHQMAAGIDGWDGQFSGLEYIDGKGAKENETGRPGTFLANGRQHTLIYTVRRNSVNVGVDGKNILSWKGEPERLSMPIDWRVPDNTRLTLGNHGALWRISKVEILPLAPGPGPTTPAPPASPATPDRRPPLIVVKGRPTNVLKQIDPARDAVKGSWTINNGALMSPSDDFASLALPAVPFEEYRLTVRAERLEGNDTLSFGLPIGQHQVVAAIDAWEGKFSGLETIDGKQCYENESSREGHVLEPGRSYNLVYTVRRGSIRVDANGKKIIDWNGDPARLAPIAVFKAPDPKQLVIGTAHSSIFKISKIELSPLSEPGSGEEKPSQADVASGQENDSRQPVPDDDELRKARQEFQKKYGAQLSAVAKSPDQKRSLAVDLIQKADVTGKTDATTYTSLRQATDLAESAGDLDIAWQATDLLAKRFALNGVALRQDSLAEVAKAAKSPEQCALLAEAGCRLMVSALGAKDPTAVKKAASQATTLAKRTKDKAVQKTVMARTSDAGKLAAELDAVAAAREALKSSPDDPKANFTIGHYELCAGDWQLALPKLAKADDADWRKLAADELALDSELLPGTRRAGRAQQSLAARQLAVADAWWSRADDEPWPGRHYLRMRAGRWYGRARSSLVADDRLRVDNRLKMLLATDEGLPALELLKFGNGEPTDDVAQVQSGRSLQTPVDYDGPIAITLVARATSTDFQLHSHRSGWLWDFKLVPNRWHVIRYVITAPARTAFVDGLLVYTETPKTNRTLKASPVTIFVANNGESVEIKKLLIEPL
jgi:hypothetical protein